LVLVAPRQGTQPNPLGLPYLRHFGNADIPLVAQHLQVAEAAALRFIGTYERSR
jgi:hypothetical protein